MKKILLKINKEKELSYDCDGYILGIDNFSYLFEKTFSLDDIKALKKETNKEIFVSFNQIIFENKLEEYKKALKEVDKLGVNGIIIGDVAALTYNLNTPLILDQLHLNNSYMTINYYANNGVFGIVLTNDITKQEINEISLNTNAILFKQVFGYPHLSTSRRKLVSNYFKHFNKTNNNDKFQIKEKKSESSYNIYEDDFGTHILGDKVLNLFGIDLDVDYLIIDGILLDDIKDALDMFTKNNIDLLENINQVYKTDTGFIDRKTIYKVKKDEK